MSDEELVTKIIQREDLYKSFSYLGSPLFNMAVQIYGTNPILLSAPHAVNQKRDNKLKYAEYFTGALAEQLAEDIGCSVITKQYVDVDLYNDDANYEFSCLYKDVVSDFIGKNNIKLFVDIHGLAKDKTSSIDIATNYHNNLVHMEILDLLQIADSSYNKYYKADNNCVMSNYVHDNMNIDSLELEINGRYRWFFDDTLEQSLQMYKDLRTFLLKSIDFYKVIC